MIRISSQQIFQGGVNRLQDLNSGLQKTQEQVSTGKRVNNPSDDPVAAARILKLNQEVAQTEQFQRNVDLAENRLQQEESTLASINDVLQRVRELTVQAGSGALSSEDLQSLASELRQRLDQMASLANTRDASGEYIFSGFKGGTQAFIQDESGSWVYQGDEGQRSLELDAGVSIPISDHGKKIFTNIENNKPFTTEAPATGPGRISPGMMVDQTAFEEIYPDELEIKVDTGNGTFSVLTSGGVDLTPADNTYTSGEPIRVAGLEFEITDAQNNEIFQVNNAPGKQSLFATVEKLIGGLENQNKTTPGGREEFDSIIANSLANLDNAQESILKTQTEIGGRLNAVESTGKFLEDSSVFTKGIRSQLQDVDYAEAISRLSFQSFVLEAAQQSFARVSQISLFDRL